MSRQREQISNYLLRPPFGKASSYKEGAFLDDSMNIYETTRWKRKREHILKRDRYVCQHYKKYGKRIDADTVHHIYPLEEYPEYSFCDWNLISLSNKAHNMMHDRKTRKLTEQGEALKRKVKREMEGGSPSG